MLIVFDDMAADMEANKKLRSLNLRIKISTSLNCSEDEENSTFLFFLKSHSYFKVPKTIRPELTKKDFNK